MRLNYWDDWMNFFGAGQSPRASSARGEIAIVVAVGDGGGWSDDDAAP